MVLPAMEEKNLAKILKENDKKISLTPWPIEEREKSFWNFWNSEWTREKQRFLKNSLYDFRLIENAFDWSRTNQAAIETVKFKPKF